MFHELEGVAGVERVRGRGWYDVRPIASDVVEDVEVDGRVQDAVLENRKSTRRARYQERGRKQTLARASDTRHTMRGRPASKTEGAGSVDAAVTALHALRIALSDAQIDEFAEVNTHHRTT